MTHKLEMKYTETNSHFGDSEVAFSTTNAGNLEEVIIAFNAMLSVMGFASKVTIEEVEE